MRFTHELLKCLEAELAAEEEERRAEEEGEEEEGEEEEEEEEEGEEEEEEEVEDGGEADAPVRVLVCDDIVGTLDGTRVCDANGEERLMSDGAAADLARACTTRA